MVAMYEGMGVGLHAPHCLIVGIISPIIVKTPTQLQNKQTLTSTVVGFNMKMTFQPQTPTTNPQKLNGSLAIEPQMNISEPQLDNWVNFNCVTNH